MTNVNGNPSCVHQVAGVTASATTFAPGCGPDATHQANWEIAISDTDGSTLPPGAIWTNSQVALNLANYANFTPGTSAWFSPCVPGSAYVSDPHFAVYFQGSLVFSNGITAPDCRAPQGQQTLSGYVTPAIAGAPVVGPVPASTMINLEVGVPVQDPTALATEAHQVSDPTSPSYRQYLTTAQFVSTFAASAADYQAVANWAQSNGLTVTATYPNRLVLDVRGTAGQIEQALFANLVFRQRPDGSLFYSLERDPTLCSSINVPILRISGLDNRVLGVPQAGSAPGGADGSADVRAAYASCTASTGSTQSLGLFELDGYTASDITKYECRSSLVTCNATGTTITAGTAPTLNNVLVNGSSGNPSSNTNQVVEVTADISLAIGMAPGLQQVSVFEAPNDGSLAGSNGILNQMALNPGIRQFSSSWTFGVDQNTQNILYEMSIQGQSFFESSGDQGSSSWSGDPGDIRDEDGVTVVGATVLTLTGPPQAYGSETTWNQTNLGASGGGFANSTVIPSYQQPFNLAAFGQPSFRQLPDVSMVGANTFIVFNGNNGNFFGTSAAAPLWAGFTALANDISAQNNLGPVGFPNPFLYFVAGLTTATYQANFNDISDGSNNAGTGTQFVNWTPTAGNFAAGSGYDLATGLGTPKCALLNTLGTGTISNGTGGTGGGGTGGSGGTGGTGGTGGSSSPAITSVTAVRSSSGLDICMTGVGFDPGHLVTLRYGKLSDVSGGLVLATDPQGASGSVEGDGSFIFDDETFSTDGSELSGVLLSSVCGTNGASALLIITDDSTGQVATTPLTSDVICNLPLQDIQTGDCPLPP